MKKIIYWLFIFFACSKCIQAQTVNSYVFSESMGSYNSLTNGTVIAASPNFNDDDNFTPINLGFTFFYHGTPFTSIALSANCFAVLGSSTFTSYMPLTSQANCISPMGGDMLGNSATHQLSYLVMGPPGNQIFVAEWHNWGKYSTGLSEFNIQLRLIESTQEVQFIYQPASPTSTFTAQVGLTGATVSDFNIRTSTSSWIPTSAGVSNMVSMNFSNLNFPSNGLIYSWVPPAPCSGTPTAGNTICSVSLPICSGSNYSLSLNGTTVASGLTYQWQSSPNGSTWTNISGGVSSAYSTNASSPGTIYYQCIVTCTASGLSSTSTPIIIGIVQSPTVTISPNTSQTFCIGGSVTLTANGASSYLWNTGATTTSINVTTTGNYSVTGTSGGCSVTSSYVFVNVIQPPVPIISPLNAILCPGGSLILTASNASTYLWNTGATSSSIIVTAAGTYTVTGTTNGCTSQPVSKIVTIGTCTVPGSLATSGITQHSAIVHWTNAACYSGYQIYVKRTQFTNWQYINVGAGTLLYQLTNLQNNYNVQWKIRTLCSPGVYSAWSNVQTIHTLPRLESDSSETNNSNDFRISVFPNPTNGNVTVQLNTYCEESNVIVSNLLGQIIFQKIFNTAETIGEINFNLSECVQGIYLVYVLDENEKRFIKVLKE